MRYEIQNCIDSLEEFIYINQNDLREDQKKNLEVVVRDMLTLQEKHEEHLHR